MLYVHRLSKIFKVKCLVWIRQLQITNKNSSFDSNQLNEYTWVLAVEVKLKGKYLCPKRTG
jgi:hypothetical protein